jgi:hypothetical protein
VSQEEYEEDSENEGNVDIKVNRGKMKVKQNSRNNKRFVGEIILVKTGVLALLLTPSRIKSRHFQQCSRSIGFSYGSGSFSSFSD